SCAARTKETAAASPSGCAADLVTASTAKDSATVEMPTAEVDSRRSIRISRNWLMRSTARDSRNVALAGGGSAVRSGARSCEGASATAISAVLLTGIYLVSLSSRLLQAIRCRQRFFVRENGARDSHRDHRRRTWRLR